MKIALVNETFTEGMGYTENLLPKYLAKLGHEVHVLTSDLQVSYYYGQDIYGAAIPPVVDPGIFTVDGFTLHRLQHRIVLGYPWLRGLGRRLRSLKPDVVQVQGCASLFAMQCALAAPTGGYKLYTAAHQHASVMGSVTTAPPVSISRLSSTVRRALPGRLVASVSERCFAITADCAEVAARYYGVPRSRIAVRPLGCDTDTFWPVSDDLARRQRVEMRAALGFLAGDIVCIYTGRFSAAKNPACLARAIDLLRQRGKPFRGLFVGGGPQADVIGSTPGCVLHGFVPTTALAPLYRCADIGVWPSEDSMSMIDAAACGLPLVVSDRMRDLSRIDGNGLPYSQGDPEALARALEALEDDAVRARMGAIGASRMAATHSWSDLAETRAEDYRLSLG